MSDQRIIKWVHSKCDKLDSPHELSSKENNVDVTKVPHSLIFDAKIIITAVKIALTVKSQILKHIRAIAAELQHFASTSDCV
jgi:3-hydroxyacyl-CoA dehydrogenase